MSEFERPRTNDICDIRAQTRAVNTPTFVAPLAAIASVGGAELCEYCGEDSLVWRKCKQLCATCGNINRSCADL